MNLKTLLYILIMAVVTYLIRMLPLTLFRKRITSKLVNNFLYYVPYAVLGAMTIPAIFYSTGSFLTAAAGFVVAIILSLKNKSLIIVAGAACAAAYLASLIELAIK